MCVPVISAAAGWFDLSGHALLRHHLVLQETNEERRTVANNLTSVFTTAANHVSTSEVNLSYLHNLIPAHSFVIFVMSLQQKCLEDLHSRVQRLCSKAVEEDEAALQKLKDTLKDFVSKANSL